MARQVAGQARFTVPLASGFSKSALGPPCSLELRDSHEFFTDSPGNANPVEQCFVQAQHGHLTATTFEFSGHSVGLIEDRIDEADVVRKDRQGRNFAIAFLRRSHVGRELSLQIHRRE